MSGPLISGASMRAMLHRTALLAFIAAVTLVEMATPATAHGPERVSARLGISAGAAIEDAPLGLAGGELRQRIPLLFETAREMDVRIETVSVGQGFFADEGALLSEKDLDLVVTGRRERITAMAATLGKAFDQSVVFVWFFEPGGAQATAALPLPGGAESLTDEHYGQLIAELADGGHVLYAGDADLIFVANIGEEPEAAFLARMERARALLAGLGIPTGAVRCERAHFIAVERDDYDRHIADSRAQPATAVSGAEHRTSSICA